MYKSLYLISNFNLKNISVGIFLLVLLLTTSCGSRRMLYNPAEVAYLSEQLKISIALDDPNMDLFAEVSLWLGTPYRYGGNTKKGTDCSGFVGQVYRRVYGKELERSSDNQAKKNVREIRKGSLEPGDLVFFRTLRNSKKIDHVGIFLKNGRFIHASTSKGVIVSSLDEEYYRKNWQKGGRVK
ncbi:NlpC/P60 family protein [Dysgonomonas sp. OttesenSCG-928-M03]|nr:NlpC/P60 family protein [Dysgonomonas sp. OttesenSCG-928-M03]